jgi:hypothetical protein
MLGGLFAEHVSFSLFGFFHDATGNRARTGNRKLADAC